MLYYFHKQSYLIQVCHFQLLFFFYETDVFLDFLPLNVQESVLTFRELRFIVIKRVLT